MKKYKIKVCLVIPPCDIYSETSIEIKNKIIKYYTLHNINLIKDNTNIIVMNDDVDNFMQL